MSSMKKLLESIDAIGEAKADDVTIKFTRAEALKHGLLTCKCGHPENNHFNHTNSCARYDCKKYREVPVAGKLVATVSKPEVKDVGTQPGQVKGDWDMQRLGDMLKRDR